ncbi:MAG: AMP-binding protein [Deltaproteobacteria bacterium]
MNKWKSYTSLIKIKGHIYDLSLSRNLDSIRSSGIDDEIINFIELWISDIDHIEQRTSGTTGEPKIIKIHKDIMVFSAKNTGKFLHLKPNDRALLCLPVDFIAGKMMIVRALVLGLDLDYQKPVGTIKLAEKIEFCAMTPFQLLNSIENGTLNKIKKLIVGGAPVSEALLEKLQQFTTSVYETYGMTETASHIALKKLNGPDRTDHFMLMDGIDIKTNHESQLIITSKGLKIKNLLTNDIVRISGRDLFKWIGRKDNVINSGGIKLYPELIESKLKSEFPNDFFIFGLLNDRFGQSPAIVIEGVTDIDLEALFKRKLEKYEIPVKVFNINNFVRTVSGKINRNATIENLL